MRITCSVKGDKGKVTPLVCMQNQYGYLEVVEENGREEGEVGAWGVSWVAFISVITLADSSALPSKKATCWNEMK